jgi:hypothetical protein
MAPPPSVASAAVGTAAAALVVLHAPRSLETATSEGPSQAMMVPLSTSSGAVGTAATASAVQPAPRSLTKPGLNEGWQKVESRRSRRRWLKPVRSRRPVPADLAGRCFNCFSTTHFAAQCQQRTRCFRCRALSHRLAVCPKASAGDVLTAGRRSAWPTKRWRPKEPGMAAPGPLLALAEALPRRPTPIPATATGAVALNPIAVLGQGAASERRRRRP